MEKGSWLKVSFVRRVKPGICDLTMSNMLPFSDTTDQYSSRKLLASMSRSCMKHQLVLSALDLLTKLLFISAKQNRSLMLQCNYNKPICNSQRKSTPPYSNLLVKPRFFFRFLKGNVFIHFERQNAFQNV